MLFRSQLLLLPDVQRVEAAEPSEAPKLEAPEPDGSAEKTVAYERDPVPEMQGVQPVENPELPAPAEPAPDEQEGTPTPYARTSVHEVTPHPKPKHTYSYLAAQTLADLRKIGREFNVAGPTTMMRNRSKNSDTLPTMAIPMRDFWCPVRRWLSICSGTVRPCGGQQ